MYDMIHVHVCMHRSSLGPRLERAVNIFTIIHIHSTFIYNYSLTIVQTFKLATWQKLIYSPAGMLVRHIVK